MTTLGGFMGAGSRKLPSEAGYYATSFSTSETQNVYGSWTALIAAPSFDCEGFTLSISPFSTGYNATIDIAITDATTLIVKELFLVARSSSNYGCQANWNIPVRVPANCTLYIRALSSASGSKSLFATCNLWGSGFGFPGFSVMEKIVTYTGYGGSSVFALDESTVTSEKYQGMIVQPVYYGTENDTPILWGLAEAAPEESFYDFINQKPLYAVYYHRTSNIQHPPHNAFTTWLPFRGTTLKLYLGFKSSPAGHSTAVFYGLR